MRFFSDHHALTKTLKNHPLAMVLCCAVPLILIMVLSFAGNLGSWGYLGIMLLCPLLHVVMMRGHQSHADDMNTPLPSVTEADGIIPVSGPVKDRKGSE